MSLSSLSGFHIRAAFRAPRRFPLPVASSFHSSTSRRVLKESDRHRDENPGMAEEIEKHKQDQINQRRDGKGKWAEQLASLSEEDVKADRGEVTDPSFEKFQERKEREAREREETAKT